MRRSKSAREDGRGGWPSGKPRHEQQGHWPATLRALGRLLTQEPKHGVRSRKALARDLEASDRTVRRWLSGEDLPPPATQDAVRAWVAHQSREAKEGR